MDQDLKDAYAERDFRQLHKRKTWSIRDQADQNGWERHDNNLGIYGEPLVHGMPYGICTVCDYLEKVEADVHGQH